MNKWINIRKSTLGIHNDKIIQRKVATNKQTDERTRALLFFTVFVGYVDYLLL